jgi:alpha-ketoglutarate-dependent taurine dioxygenase
MSQRQAVSGPEAWQIQEVESTDDWRFSLNDSAREALVAASRRAAADGLEVFQVAREHFFSPATETLFSDIHHQLEQGFGFALLSGLPVDELDHAQNLLLACGVAAQVGEVVVQNYEGQCIVDVRDDQVPYSHTSRGYRSNALLPFHTDGAGLFMLSCLGQAAEGGETVIASAGAVYNTVLAERPDVMPFLERGYFHHRRGQHDAGEPPLSPERIPVFSFHEGLLHCCYNRNPIEWVTHEGMELEDGEREALDVLDEILARPEMRLRLQLAPGEALFVNNFTVLHSRTAYRDGPDQRRHLLRVWMDDPDSRRVGQTLLDLYVPGTSRFSRL